MYLVIQGSGLRFLHPWTCQTVDALTCGESPLDLKVSWQLLLKVFSCQLDLQVSPWARGVLTAARAPPPLAPLLQPAATNGSCHLSPLSPWNFKGNSSSCHPCHTFSFWSHLSFGELTLNTTCLHINCLDQQNIILNPCNLFPPLFIILNPK